MGYRGYIGIMENEMETAISSLGFRANVRDPCYIFWRICVKRILFSMFLSHPHVAPSTSHATSELSFTSSFFSIPCSVTLMTLLNRKSINLVNPKPYERCSSSKP